MHKFIIENGVLGNIDDNDKSLLKATEPLKGGDGEHYRGVRAVVVSVNDVVLFLEAYEYAKEKFNNFMMVNAKYDYWKTFEKPVELIDDVADDSVKVIVNYKNGDKKIIERKDKPASVSKEVKAAAVKAEVETTTELVKEDNSMNNMITLAPAELNALLTAARSSVVDTTSQIIYRDREIVPADYDQLKKDLETARKTAATWQSKAADLEKQIAELKAQLAASSKVDTHVPTLKEDLADEKFEQEVKDAFDSPFDDDFCDFNKAINLVAEAEARKEKKKADAAEEAKRKGIVTKYFDAYSAYHFVKGNLDYIKNACPDKKKWQSFADEIEDYDCFTAEEITFVRDVAYGC